MNPKNVLYNTTFSVQLPYIADHSLQIQYQIKLNILVKCRNLDLCLLYGRKVQFLVGNCTFNSIKFPIFKCFLRGNYSIGNVTYSIEYSKFNDEI